MGWVRSLLVMLLAVASVALPARGAAESRPTLVVVPFAGPAGAKAAEAIVVRALRRKATVVPPEQWTAAARKLYAKRADSDDIAAVAEDVGADVVITGVMRSAGRKWDLLVTVREGASGKTRERLSYSLKGPSVDGSTQELLASEVARSFDQVSASLGARPRITRLSPPSSPTNGEDSSAAKPADPVRGDDERPEAAPESTPSVPSSPPALGGRPRWYPYVDVTLAGLLSGRSFGWVPSSLPSFATGTAGGLRADLTLYPLASTYRSARGVFGSLGLGATLDLPFWPATRSAADASTYATSELRVDGGLRWRFVLRSLLPRPELMLLAGAGLHRFAIEKRVDANGNLVDAGPPDVAYSFLSLGLSLRLSLTEWCRLWVAARIHLLFDAGPITAADGYGPATAFGVRPELGLDFFVWKGLKLIVSGHYERVSLSFLGSDPPPAKPGGGIVAVSALDQYYGGAVGIGYEY